MTCDNCKELVDAAQSALVLTKAMTYRVGDQQRQYEGRQALAQAIEKATGKKPEGWSS